MIKICTKLFLILAYFAIASCGGGGGGDKPDGPITPDVVAVTSVTLSKTSQELEIGNTFQLTATVNPSNATNKHVDWVSSNSAVATVTPTGLVTAKSEGTANITATADGKSAVCKVTVKKPAVPVASVELDKTDVTLDAEETVILKATVKPDDATDKTITWASSNTSVATVDNNGKVTGIDNGTVNITATSGGKTATCKVTVIVQVKSITLDITSETIAVGKEPLTLTATVNPSNAADKTVTWTSSNPSVATVDRGAVTAVNSGTATITAEASGKTATCEITVIILVESVTLNKTELIIKEGVSETLVATVKPDSATDKTVTWTSSDTAVATVDSNGKVDAKVPGVAVIKATSGDQSASCIVTVTKQGGLEDRPDVEI